MAQDESCGVTGTIVLMKEYRTQFAASKKAFTKAALLALCSVFWLFVIAVENGNLKDPAGDELTRPHGNNQIIMWVDAVEYGL
jgi:hypothetical protein